MGSFATARPTGGGRARHSQLGKINYRSAAKAAIGYMKAKGHLGWRYLNGAESDVATVILGAAVHNLRLVLT